MGEWRLNIFLLLLNVSLGFALLKDVRVIAAEQPRLELEPSRQPASVPGLPAVTGEAATAAQNPAMAQTLNLNCLNQKKIYQLQSQERIVRLTGEWCREAKSLELNVENRNRGLNALVFDLPGRKFSTEYLDLQPGENVLFLKATDDRGRSQLTEVHVQFQ